MARSINCPSCDKRYKELAIEFNELYESKIGKAKREFNCDDCYKPIHVGDLCYASVLLPNKEHFNYQIQKPDAWMIDFLNPV